jgi:transglutaminase-like putative cysteine protease
MPSAPVASGGDADRAASEPGQGRYLQLPPLSPGIERLARQVTAGSADPYDAALKLNQFLSSRFRYTLAKPHTSLDPLEEFLFVRRAGNCEYFAAALAVMLRTLGTPARVVGGFQRGDWNPYGRYFMVRLADAHAWVEADFAGRGWVTFDPSPRGATTGDTLPSSLALYLDAARMRWYRYVVNWSLQDQRVIASTVHRQARDMKLAFAWPDHWPRKLWAAVAVAIGAGGVIGWLVWRAGSLRRASRPAGRPPRFYDRALRALARRGLSPGPAETARQFWHRAEREAPQWAEPLGRITATYERVRFGLAVATEEEMHEVERCLVALERR